MIDKYPYTNMHEINLDWIISQIKSIDPELIAALRTLDPDTLAQVKQQVQIAEGYATTAQSFASAASTSADACAESASNAAGSASAAGESASNAAESASNAADSSSSAANVAANYTSGYYSTQSITFNSDISDHWTTRLLFGSPSFTYLISQITTLNTITPNSPLLVLPEESRPVIAMPITIMTNSGSIGGQIDTDGNVKTSETLTANTPLRIQALICSKYR